MGFSLASVILSVSSPLDTFMVIDLEQAVPNDPQGTFYKNRCKVVIAICELNEINLPEW